MWKVTPPTQSVDSVLKLCISNIREPGLKSKLSETSDALMAASKAFVTALNEGTVHLFPKTDSVGNVEKCKLIWLYDMKMANSKAPGRIVYDELKMAAPNGRCPLCGRGIVSTLDHHLPKSRYVNLTIAPMNLVPSCQDCNKNKTEIAAEVSFEVPIHPYTDDIDGQIWLRAKVIEVSPPALFFFADPPASWDATLRDRVRGHFRMFKLRPTYATEGATLISNMRNFLVDYLGEGEPDAIRGHLLGMAKSSRKNNLNSWQAAAYTGMAESDWFCNGGYAEG